MTNDSTAVDFGINLLEEEIDDVIFRTNEFLTDATFTGGQGPFWSLPPPPSFLPFCKDSSSVSAVSLAAARLLIYFSCIGLTLRLYSTLTKLMMLKAHPFGVSPAFLFIL